MGQITSDLIIAARVGGTRGTDWIEKNIFFCCCATRLEESRDDNIRSFE